MLLTVPHHGSNAWGVVQRRSQTAGRRYGPRQQFVQRRIPSRNRRLGLRRTCRLFLLHGFNLRLEVRVLRREIFYLLGQSITGRLHFLHKASVTRTASQGVAPIVLALGLAGRLLLRVMWILLELTLHSGQLVIQRNALFVVRRVSRHGSTLLLLLLLKTFVNGVAVLRPPFRNRSSFLSLLAACRLLLLDGPTTAAASAVTLGLPPPRRVCVRSAVKDIRKQGGLCARSAIHVPFVSPSSRKKMRV